MALPIQALLARLGSRGAQDEWSRYLPLGLHGPREGDGGGAVGRPSQPLGQGTPEAAISAACLRGGGRSAAVQGRVWTLAQESRGCRWVQEAIRKASRAEAAELASELRGHVASAAWSPHANHVLQLLIATLAPEECQFIVDEIAEVGILECARNKYGCRIIQRLVERCPRQQAQGVLAAVLMDVRELSMHPYSNYVLQHILMHGSCDDRKRIARVALDNATKLCRTPHGCVVVLAAFEDVSPDRQETLAERLAQEEGLLVSIACSRQGAGLVARVLDTLRGRGRGQAISTLAAAAGLLNASQHGRAVLSMLGVPVASVVGVGVGP
mmetsp:Transcript_122108/g.350813  ORF Transcript_122108/g.350813 Transcript_122108/m.350813 type:complete len:326 (-) Transcript_122108:357-1334(-)